MANLKVKTTYTLLVEKKLKENVDLLSLLQKLGMAKLLIVKPTKKTKKVKLVEEENQGKAVKRIKLITS